MTPADVDAVAALVAACELAATGVVEIDREDIVAEWSRPGFDITSDSVGVLHDGRLVGEAEVFRGTRAEAHVHPSHRGMGIGTWLLAWTERVARAAGAPHVGQTVSDADLSAGALLAAHGYRHGHTSWLLEIEHTLRPPAPQLPDGIVLRPYVPGDDDRAVYQVIEDAFSEWPGREPTAYEDWAALTIARPRFAPWHVRLATETATDEIVGVAFLIDYDTDEGWVQQLATRASQRHRGVARALLTDAFGVFWERGKRRVGLSTDSRTGALALYEKVGMTVRASYTHHVKDL